MLVRALLAERMALDAPGYRRPEANAEVVFWMRNQNAGTVPVSKFAAERFLLALDGRDVYVLRLPFVYGDGDPHIAEGVPMMPTLVTAPTQVCT